MVPRLGRLLADRQGSQGAFEKRVPLSWECELELGPRLRDGRELLEGVKGLVSSSDGELHLSSSLGS